MKRRDFMKIAGVGAVGAATSLHAGSKKKVKIKLATSWPANFPIMGTGVDRFAQRVKEMSGGAIKIKVYPAGVLVPALSVFDACSKGQIDAFHSGPYYWKGKNPAFSLFTGFPFGFTPEEQNAWLLFGGGLELWRKLYAKHNLYPLPGGNTGTQMGGWFRKPVKNLADLKGLKMRIPGLGGEVLAKLGVNPVLMAAGEIYTSLERGTIDATEWIAPDHDLRMGFYKVAKYYYTGWHEPGSTLELTFNKQMWEGLADEHKAILTEAAMRTNAEMGYEFQAANAAALAKLEGQGITTATFPKEVTDAAKKAMEKVVGEQSAQSADFKEVWASCNAFMKTSRAWTALGAKSFLETRG